MKHHYHSKGLDKQFMMGMKVEREHSDDYSVRHKIVCDHLREDPNYYTKLKRAKL